jgi:hypothetical protein
MYVHYFADSSTVSSVRLTGTAYPLDIEDRRYYHPSSRAQWERVPGRPTAWRIHPYSYMWVPSSELFPAVGHSQTGSFPREFTLLVTLRIHPQVRFGSFYAVEFFHLFLLPIWCTISLFCNICITLNTSTCFEQYMLIFRRSKLYFTASGIVTLCERPCSAPVESSQPVVIKTSLYYDARSEKHGIFFSSTWKFLFTS